MWTQRVTSIVSANWWKPHELISLWVNCSTYLTLVPRTESFAFRSLSLHVVFLNWNNKTDAPCNCCGVKCIGIRLLCSLRWNLSFTSYLSWGWSVFHIILSLWKLLISFRDFPSRTLIFIIEFPVCLRL